MARHNGIRLQLGFNCVELGFCPIRKSLMQQTLGSGIRMELRFHCFGLGFRFARNQRAPLVSFSELSRSKPPDVDLNSTRLPSGFSSRARDSEGVTAASPPPPTNMQTCSHAGYTELWFRLKPTAQVVNSSMLKIAALWPTTGFTRVSYGFRSGNLSFGNISFTNSRASFRSLLMSATESSKSLNGG